MKSANKIIFVFIIIFFYFKAYSQSSDYINIASTIYIQNNATGSSATELSDNDLSTFIEATDDIYITMPKKVVGIKVIFSDGDLSADNIGKIQSGVFYPLSFSSSVPYILGTVTRSSKVYEIYLYENPNIIELSFNYDASGNCTSRPVISLKSATDTSTLLVSAGRPEYSEIDKEEPSKPLLNLQSTEVKVYPNPTKGNLVVDIKGNVDNLGALNLYNMKGSLVLKQKKAQSHNNLDLTSYPIGNYILTLEVNGQRKEWKIIKE